MSTYVMSDIHGCYDKMLEMLKKIEFSELDKLIVAGDYIDRGTQSFEMLMWLEKHSENIILLRGNHEEEFLYCIELMETFFGKYKMLMDSMDDTKYIYELVTKIACADGEMLFDYYGTIHDLIFKDKVNMNQLIKWTAYMKAMPYLYDVMINNRRCVVVHAGYVDSLEGVNFNDKVNSLEEFYLYARDDAYIFGGIKNGMIISGHTPTIFEEELPFNDGNVYRSYDDEIDCVFYDVDCGCAYRFQSPNAKLACLRLEDEKIFYV